MKTVFSVEDSSSSAAGEAKKPGPTMNPSASEEAFLKFVTEQVDKKGEDGEEGETKGDLGNNGFSESNGNINVPLDMEEYQPSLKNKLDFACAALAMSRPSFVKPQDSAARADCGSQTTATLRFGSKATSKGAVDKDGNGPVGFPSFLSGQKKSGVQVRPITIGSSSDLSEEDDLLGESARRSRRRKQANLSQLETEVAQLRLKKAAFLKQFTDISQKYNNALITNRILAADVEALEAKVKLREELFKRIYGFSYGSIEISTKRMPPFVGSLSNTSKNASVPGKDGSKHPIYQAAANKPISTHDLRTNNAFSEGSSVSGTNIGQATSLQGVASLEHLQKQIGKGASPRKPKFNSEGK
ncbi:hypothetical protein V6N13_020073 [Hibiscus sabdariffa]|uniref:Basic leucine-zipper C-terminal domain-containing protein n=1 Tax=Hibiscus sabdariffa TaxID=183260 RepID=A0ABR2ESD3_9ROSI